MQPYLTLGFETAALIVVIAVFQIAVLAVRNPACPGWLKKSGMDSVIALVIVSAFSFAFAFEISAMISLGIPVVVAIAVASALVLGAGYLSWRVAAPWRRQIVGRPDANRPQMPGNTPAHV